MSFIRWNGRNYYQKRRKPVKPDINELMKPLGEKQFKGNVWGSVIMNVEKDGITPTPTIDPDYQAVLDYATTQGYTLPSTSGQTLQNNLVVSLKSAGIWSDLDLFYVFATDGDDDFATINWKSISSYQGIINGLITLYQNQGFRPDTANVANYINTQFNWNTNGTGYTQDDACRFLWDYDATYIGAVYDGQLGGARETFNGGNNNLHRITQDSASLPTNFDNTGSGFKMIQRTSSTNVNLYNNTTTPTSFNVNSAPSPNTDPQTIFRRGGSGNSQNFISLYGMGASLSGKETALFNALTTYMSGL